MIFTNISIASYDKASTFLYAVEGSILFFFNLFSVLRFLLNKYHRSQKDSLLLVGYLIFDTVFGLTYMCSGIYRINLIYFKHYEYFPAFTKWQCMGTPAILFLFITPTAGILVFVTALDRCYVAMYPIRYQQLKFRYALTLLIIPYFTALLPIIKALFGSYAHRFVQEESSTCNLEATLTLEDFSIVRLIRVVLTLLCVLIYVPTTLKMYQNIRAHNKLTGGVERNQKKLLRMTLTIALITSNTILMFTIPDIILLNYPSYKSNIFYILNLNKGVINLIIFVATQRSFRQIVLGRPGTSVNPNIKIMAKSTNTFDGIIHRNGRQVITINIQNCS